jgi:hypothetical protein
LADKRARLIFLYSLFALVWDVYTMSAIGVAYNGILDFYISVALLTGLAIGRFKDVTRVAALAAVVFPLGVVASNLPKPHRVWESFQQIEKEFAEDEALLRSVSGPAMCYTGALCYWAGKPFEYDHFNEIRKMDLDPEYRKRFVRKLDEKYFAIIQLKTLAYLPIHRLEHMPDDVIAALNRNYVFVRESKTGRKYYRPKQ